ncbi:MAG TPA: hypothetical protein VKG23_04155 [Thermoanaerobaculia bacterium]|nr:hypothetical protein [Thermoanaerobaculia bacterium]
MPALPKQLGSRRQAILLGVLAVVLCLALVRWRPGGDVPAPAAPSKSAAASRSAPARPFSGDPSGDDGAAPSRARRGSAKEVNPDDVPVISVADLAPARERANSDPGRDLFELRDPTHPPLPTPTPAPPAPGDVRFMGPLPPPPPTPTPAPPEIAFKFIGTFGPKDHPIAVVQQGDQVLNVRTGDKLFGKFILRKVGYESIDVGFVGFPESETRRLGIAP